MKRLCVSCGKAFSYTEVYGDCAALYNRTMCAECCSSRGIRVAPRAR